MFLEGFWHISEGFPDLDRRFLIRLSLVSPTLRQPAAEIEYHDLDIQYITFSKITLDYLYNISFKKI